jgi:hypothetical protein
VLYSGNTLSEPDGIRATKIAGAYPWRADGSQIEVLLKTQPMNGSPERRDCDVEFREPRNG